MRASSRVMSAAAFGIREAAGVDLHHRGAGGLGGFQLVRLGVDEQGNPGAVLRQEPAGGLDFGELAGHVQAAFGGEFLAPLGHQAGILRAHLQAMASISSVTAISRFILVCSKPAQDTHVGVLDVAPVFAQVQGDGVGPGGFRQQGGLDRAGIAGAAGLAQGGHMVDVDAEADGLECGHSFCRSMRSCRVASGLSPR